jgi:hypothetical protein
MIPRIFDQIVQNSPPIKKRLMKKNHYIKYGKKVAEKRPDNLFAIILRRKLKNFGILLNFLK